MTPPIVERLRRKVLYRPNEWQLANPNGPEAADNIEELVEGLGVAINALRPSQLYPGTRDEWEAHQRDTQEWIEALLTKIGGDA